MAINDSKKTDFLWKKIIFGVTETDTQFKAGANEAIASPIVVFNENFYVESGDIPKPAPAADTSVIKVWKGATAIQCKVDPSVAGNKTWIAVEDFSGPIDETNRLTDFIGFNIHPSYLVLVYNGNPTSGGQTVNSLIPNQEWVFDYVAGVLHFPNNLSNLITNEVWIEAYQYIGQKGIGGGSNSTELAFTHTTGLLATGEFEDFEFETGSLSILTHLEVDKQSTVEVHSTSDRADSNPYRFKAIPAHLNDDGSYVQGGKRFYGPRYATIIGKEDPFTSTYWRIYNTDSTAQEITVTAKVKSI